MSQLMLPHYAAYSKKLVCIRNRVNRRRKHHGLKYHIWTRNDFEELVCCKCLKKKPKEQFYMRKKYQRRNSTCKDCQPLENQEWAKNNRDKIHINSKNWHHRNKIKALIRINPNLKCSNCGCTDIRFLEINHINGGGSIESKTDKQYTCMVNKILFRKRKTDDLNILCRVCNALDYLERMYGPTGLTVLSKLESGETL